MKRFYNNTKMSGAFSNALRVVALLCVLLGVSSTAWAETGFFENLDIRINGEWYNLPKNGDNRSEAKQNLGNYLPGQGPSLEEFYYRTYKNNDNVCSENSGIYVKIETNEKQWGNNVHLSTREGDGEWDGDNGSINQEWTGYADNTIFSSITSTGKKEIKLKAKVKVGNDCTQNNYIEMSNKDNFTLDNSYDTYYFFYYNVVKTIYLTGAGAVGKWDNYFEPAEPTDDKNIVRFKLKNTEQAFRFSDKSSDNWDFFRAATYDKTKDEGANLSLRNDNGLQDIQAQISQANRDAGYSSPVYFYYNTSTNKYWVKASQKAAYKIVFEDGTELGCTDLNKGEACTNSIDLGEGTYRFKVYKNGAAYHYFKNGANYTFTDNLAKTNLTAGDHYTTLIVSKYGTCTFKLQENGSNFEMTVTHAKLEEPVLIGAKVVLSSDQKSATLSAYLQGSLCTNQSITEYGFVLCSGGKDCIPTLSSIKLIPSPTSPITRGDSYTYTATTEAPDYLIGGVTYVYRAFVTIAGKTYLSRETGYFTLQDDCTQQVAGDPNKPVVFTIDAALGADYENDCKLTYGSLQTAINKLRGFHEAGDYQYVTYYTQNGHESYDLRQPVIFNVRFYDDSPDDQSKAFCYQGNKKAEVSGGGSDSENSLALIFKDFNRFSKNNHTLTIQGASGANRPWLHHVILRNSRNVVLDNLAIFSDPTGKVQDDALEFDVNTMSWNTIKVGDCADANIVVRNCMIGSNGFTGLHASGYDGITFENNEFEAIMAKVGETGNAVAWGASAKFMFCENIKFIRNNFRGAHATLVWFQDSNNALFMNNVFWNTNQYDANCAAVRLVNQYAKSVTYGNRQVENVAFLYNTFYLEDNINTQAYDFLHTSTKDNDSDVYKNITFKYNNCYSYDGDVPGKKVAPNLTDSYVCPNNYWSVNDKADFSFGDCTDVPVVSMEGLICETSATGPASLKLKVGDGAPLNYGPKLEADDDFFGTGISMSEEELTYDRYNAAIRPDPNEGGWTLGAYQAQENVEISKIYWIGISKEWDDRNNWGYYPEDVVTTSKNQAQGGNARSADLQRLTCVNTLSDNLTVVIPEHPLVQTTGGRKWPQLPANFDPDVRKAKIPIAEQVSAGETNYFAHTIELEYGAAIKGVESLRNGNEHYNNALTSVEIPRSQWVLVGTVVQPMDRSNIKSGHYYLNRLPEVYMHYVDEIDADGNATWSSTFTSLEEELEATKIYAVNIPDEYGPGKLSASRYYKYRDKNMVGDGTVSKSFNFDGKFVNDDNLPSYTITPGSYAKLSNTYPCNLSATKIEETGGQVLYYDYKEGSFKSFDPNNGDVQIKMQHGFLYKHEKNDRLDITADMLADGNTRSRSIATALPVASINLRNGNERVGSSNIIIRLDEQQPMGMPSQTDAEKVFAPNEGTPELYMMAYDKKLIRMNVASATQTIPLGIRLRKGMNVRFEKENIQGFDKVILIDALRGLEHDLTEAPFTTEWLEVENEDEDKNKDVYTVIEGRYFLNLVPAEDEYIEDDDVTTAVDENSVDASINIYTIDNNVVRIITNNVNLQSVFVSDMLGKTMEYKASGNFKDVVLPCAQGVYVVQVIGDNATRTEKVIVK